MKLNLRALLDLVRLPNLCTAMADSLAGFLYIGGGLENWPQAVSLMVASTGFYAGGVAMNDICDLHADQSDRPHRPIPSGRISLNLAAIVVMFAFSAGVALSFGTSTACGIIGGCLILSIVLYNRLLKHTWLAPGFMGICRALNLALGMSFANQMRPMVMHVIPIAGIWLYVTSVTVFARTETTISSKARLLGASSGIGIAVMSLAILNWVIPQPNSGFLFLVLALCIGVVLIAQRASTHAEPSAVQRSVGLLILGIIAFDACFVWAHRGIAVASLVGVLILPTILLKQKFRVT